MMEAERIFAAAMRHYTELGQACLSEFTLKTNRRPDIICLAKDGQITIIEVKSSIQDFRSDKKWQDYLAWADQFFFAVDDSFPTDILPDESQCGIIITDGFDCHQLRDAPHQKLPAARRNALIKLLARTAMLRHYHSQPSGNFFSIDDLVAGEEC